MREYELVVDERLRNGLSPVYRLPSNNQFLWECYGFRCGKAGLEAAREGSNPISAAFDIEYVWPFPQFIRGDAYNFLIIRDDESNEDAVYTVSDDFETLTHIFTIDSLTFGQGGLMRVADFGEYIIMMNGVAMIYWNPTLAAFIPSTEIATIPLMNTLCNFKGQIVGGGVTSTWYDCDESFYIWSKIGEADFTPSLNNEAGYRRCPFGGTVLDVGRLKDSVIGYSTKGVTAIVPVKDPAATFGFEELDDTGLINKGAFAAGFNKHIYVDKHFMLKEITPKEGVKELGYQYYMEQLDGEDIIVQYDHLFKDFYIGNSSKTFLLSPFGLTEIRQHPSAVFNIDDEDLYMLPAAVDSDDHFLATEVFDMGYRGNKTIFTVETDAFLHVTPQVAIDYCYDHDTWGVTDYTPINNQGIANKIASGNMFRLRLKFGTVYNPFRIGYLKARYKMTDLRGIRGVYAPPPRGQ